MKLRKVIPALVLTLALILGLVTATAPKAVADNQESQERWTIIESGYVRGRDHTVYPCSYYLQFETDTEAYSSADTAQMEPLLVDKVKAVIELQNDTIEAMETVPRMHCALEAWVYIPELDQYEKKTAAWGIYGYGNAYGEISCSIQAVLEDNEELFAGELVSVTARFYLLDQEVGTLSWSADA